MSELFEAFGVNWKLLLIQAVNFGLLLAALSYFLYKPILRIIDERREKVAEGVRLAESASRTLAEAKEEGEQLVGDAAKKAEALAAASRASAEQKGQSLVKDAQARAEQVLAEAQIRAEEVKRQTVAASEREIARAAMLAAEKLLREKSA